MAQQKFFSGLTEGMINRASGERPDRQKTHFYWPDEYAPEPAPSTSINSRRSSSTSTTASSSQLAPSITTTDHRRPEQHSTWEPVSRDRHPKHAESHIQFYDGVGSSFGELERTKAHERFRIEQFLRQQSEEETGEAARAKRLSTLQSKIEFYDYCTPSPAVNGAVRRNPAHAGRSRTENNGYGSEHDRNGDTTEHDPGEDELDFDDRSSYRSSICSSTRTTPTSGHRHYTTGTELPEHKRNSQRHLRSSINFHNGCAVADDSDDPQKPITVRESATTRVGVGLPNL
ncbi:uncharacterized protein LOC126559562 [Anopheles maculipalpis]|uniref:uncharacterized protein LOC126559562 n=1 Tax=Anopheles maculipalpis TaxID=1496333 RepID=UPI002158F72C|nr:uncharacterized protein LOC126559562 [Anopheles maculipalpis]